MSERTILGIISVFVLAFVCGIVYLFMAAEKESPSPEPPPAERVQGNTDNRGDEPVSEISGRREETPETGPGEPLPMEKVKPRTPVGALAGRVLDTTDRPVAEASVSLYRTVPAAFLKKRVSTGVTVRTNETGRYRIEPVPVDSNYALLVQAEGFAPAEMDGLSVAPDRTMEVADFRLDKGKVLQGTVTDPGGIPLAEVTVRAKDKLKELAGYPPEVHTRTKRTDGEGRFLFQGITQGQFEITFEARGYRTTTIQVNIFDLSGKPKAPEPLSVTLYPSGLAIAGLVRDEKGRPLKGARVQVLFTDARKNISYTGEARSDGKGVFRIPGLSEGRYQVRASAKGYHQKEFLSADAGAEGLAIVLAPNGAVEGSILPSGKTPRRFKVMIHSYRASFRLTEPNRVKEINGGSKRSFRFPDLFPGNYVFLVTAEGYAQAFSPEVEVLPGRTTKGVEIPLTEGGRITGTVTDRSGKPLKGIRVTLMDARYEPTLPFEEIFSIQPEQGKRSVTDGKGRFLLAHVREGVYTLKIEGADMARKVLKEIAVKEGETTDMGPVRLAAGGKIRGTAYDEQGRPAAGMKVTAVSREAGGYKTAMTDDKGRFLLTHLAPGTYTLTLALKDLWTAMRYDTSTTVYVEDGRSVKVEIYPQPRQQQKKKNEQDG